MRLLMFLIFLFPLTVSAELLEEEKLMRVVVELEELHNITREVSRLARVDADRPFPYQSVLIEISDIRAAILRHIQQPQKTLSNNKGEVVLPQKVSLNAKEQERLRAVINQCDSVLAVIPSASSSSGNVLFNYPALRSDVDQLRRYLWKMVATGRIEPRILDRLSE